MQFTLPHVYGLHLQILLKHHKVFNQVKFSLYFHHFFNYKMRTESYRLKSRLKICLYNSNFYPFFHLQIPPSCPGWPWPLRCWPSLTRTSTLRHLPPGSKCVRVHRDSWDCFASCVCQVLPEIVLIADHIPPVCHVTATSMGRAIQRQVCHLKQLLFFTILLICMATPRWNWPEYNLALVFTSLIREHVMSAGALFQFQ